jgi:hypothetical protein
MQKCNMKVSFHITILLFLVHFNDTFKSMETLENIN